jgi:hypothetical protein
MARRYLYVYGKSIYKLALYTDFYLINKLKIPLDEQQNAHIDHLLFGEKFIYVIKDKYYQGGVSGKEDDQSWVYFPFHRRGAFYIPNPFLINRQRIEKLTLVTGLDKSLFINVIVVNNDCLLDDIDTKKADNYIVNLKHLAKLIKAIETRNIAKINDEQLAQAVLDINKINKQIADEQTEHF